MTKASEGDPNHESNLDPNRIRTTVEPNPNHGRTESEPRMNIGGATIERLLKACDRVQGKYTAVALAKLCGVTDTAIRKAYKAMKQVFKESWLQVGSKYTEFAKEVFSLYFGRDKGISGAQWILALKEIWGAMPESQVDEPISSTESYWKRQKQDFAAQSSALALQKDSRLAFIAGQMVEDDLGDDEAFEAELDAIREQSYSRELQRQVAKIQGKQRAREDIRAAV